jgi:hypothetical protein
MTADYVFSDEYCNSYSVGLWSHHWDRSKDYNETHDRLGCDGIAGSSYNMHYFRNSHGDASALLSRTWVWRAEGGVSLGLEYGLVYGYGDRQINILGISPAVLPRISWSPEEEGLGLDLFLAYDQAVAIGFTWRQ